ncbi:hypothetical protein SORBI_3009G049100 [Sorghum bicolor]|uniref:Uncharacterized protein n=1 Tax=Sorghum bicolor TaxID=4558 RepID=A0A1B6P6Q0_SORBI|nr:hypothetical protein SORBI_3009G049100 [Sorghum bicolor]
MKTCLRASIELKQMSFLRVCRSSRRPLAAEVERSRPRSSSTRRRAKGRSESGAGSRGGPGATTLSEVSRRRIRRSYSSALWSSRSAT